MIGLWWINFELKKNTKMHVKCGRSLNVSHQVQVPDVSDGRSDVFSLGFLGSSQRRTSENMQWRSECKFNRGPSCVPLMLLAFSTSELLSSSVGVLEPVPAVLGQVYMLDKSAFHCTPTLRGKQPSTGLNMQTLLRKG